MGTHDHEHQWESVGLGPHFIDEPNSKRRSQSVRKAICAICEQRGIRYNGSRVVLTWDRNPANWLTEL